jgi:hypothetical protein
MKAVQDSFSDSSSHSAGAPLVFLLQNYAEPSLLINLSYIIDGIPQNLNRLHTTASTIILPSTSILFTPTCFFLLKLKLTM